MIGENIFECLDTEDLRICVWSSADKLRHCRVSSLLELFYLQLGYNISSKVLAKRLEKNKEIYITEISEGS